MLSVRSSGCTSVDVDRLEALHAVGRGCVGQRGEAVSTPAREAPHRVRAHLVVNRLRVEGLRLRIKVKGLGFRVKGIDRV